MAAYTPPKPHYGGQLGFVALLAMLILTGCMAIRQEMTATPAWFPAWAQQTSGDAPEVRPAQAVSEARMKAVYIVRFDADPALDPVGKTFRPAPAQARATYAEWAKDRPALEGLQLVRASYSGELILGLPADSARTPDEVLTAMRQMDNLVYAERDVMATIGKEGSQ